MTCFIVDTIKNGDSYQEEFDFIDTALDVASKYWQHLSLYDKKRRSEYYVCICRCTSDGGIDYNHSSFRIVRDFVRDLDEESF